MPGKVIARYDGKRAVPDEAPPSLLGSSRLSAVDPFDSLRLFLFVLAGSSLFFRLLFCLSSLDPLYSPGFFLFVLAGSSLLSRVLFVCPRWILPALPGSFRLAAVGSSSLFPEPLSPLPLYAR